MRIVCRLLIVFGLCHVAYAATCQQVFTYHEDPAFTFLGGIAAGQHYGSAFATSTPEPEIKDSTALAAETDSVEIKDTATLAFAGEPTIHIIEPVTVAGGPSAPDATIEDIADPVITRYAEMISVDAHDINNYPLYRFIDEWYGTRYSWGGEDNDGIDCSAFSQRLYGKVYSQEIERTSRRQFKTCERIRNSEDAEEGDLIFFRIHRMRVSHVGVYLANGYFVHASRSQGVVISNLDNKYWRKRYAGCGRVEKEDKATYESAVVTQ